MEWIERLNDAIHYIEEYLTGEMDYEQLARIAGCGREWNNTEAGRNHGQPACGSSGSKRLQ